MKKNRLVSVIIPTSGREGMLDKAIKSVKKQSYKDIEIIIVADNCSNETNKKYKEFADKENIIFLPVFERIGASAARNIGIKNSNGKYIAFLDDDDLWLPEKLDKQISLLEQGYLIVSCKYLADNGEGRIIMGSSGKIHLEDIKWKNLLGSFSFCVTKKEYIPEKMLDESLEAFQDWDLWISVMYNNNGEAYSIKEPLAIYNNLDNDNRITQKHGRRMKAFDRFMKKHLHIFSKAQLYYHKAFYLRIKMLYNKKFDFKSYFKIVLFLLRARKILMPEEIYSLLLQPFFVGFNKNPIKKILFKIVKK